MKKLYERPLAEVIEIKVTDIITESSFSISIGIGKAIALEGSLEAAVENGTIKLN